MICFVGKGFARHYRQLASDKYYIKLDDDIMYIQPGAIAAMLYEKLRNRFWIISANVINHSGTDRKGAAFLAQCKCHADLTKALAPATSSVFTVQHALPGWTVMNAASLELHSLCQY